MYFFSLMAQIPDMFAGNRSSEVILEPVVRAGLEALKVTAIIVCD